MSKRWATSLPDFGWFRLEFVLSLVETRHQGSGDFIVCCWIFVGQCIAPTGALARYIDLHILITYIYVYVYIYMCVYVCMYIYIYSFFFKVRIHFCSKTLRLLQGRTCLQRAQRAWGTG